MHIENGEICFEEENRIKFSKEIENLVLCLSKTNDTERENCNLISEKVDALEKAVNGFDQLHFDDTVTKTMRNALKKINHKVIAEKVEKVNTEKEEKELDRLISETLVGKYVVFRKYELMHIKHVVSADHFSVHYDTVVEVSANLDMPSFKKSDDFRYNTNPCPSDWFNDLLDAYHHADRSKVYLLERGEVDRAIGENMKALEALRAEVTADGQENKEKTNGTEV